MGVYPTAPGYEAFALESCCDKSFCGEGKLETPAGTYRIKIKDGKSTAEKL